jgi:hypothetical protein
MTTATADRYQRGPQDANLPHEQLPKLMEVYKGRSFRFAFTNRRMAEVVVAFTWDHPELWPASAGDRRLFTLAWNDDRYSLDLAESFGKAFAKRLKQANVPDDDPKDPIINDPGVNYSVGDYAEPNPQEAAAAGRVENWLAPDQRQLLVLPTGTQRARRLLRTLARRAPLEVRHLVVASGDAITFNNIYRDRELAWNVEEMPVSLIFFSHRNPVNTNAGFRPAPVLGKVADDPTATTGTQDLLLYRDIVEALVNSADAAGLPADGDVLGARLRQCRWHKGHVVVDGSADAPGIALFDAEGSRRDRTGEHIVWLRPEFQGTHVQSKATITVWRLLPENAADTWRQIEPHGPTQLIAQVLASQGLVSSGIASPAVLQAAVAVRVATEVLPLTVYYRPSLVE